jgi:hypothetical protein
MAPKGRWRSSRGHGRGRRRPQVRVRRCRHRPEAALARRAETSRRTEEEPGPTLAPRSKLRSTNAELADAVPPRCAISSGVTQLRRAGRNARCDGASVSLVSRSTRDARPRLAPVAGAAGTSSRAGPDPETGVAKGGNRPPPAVARIIVRAMGEVERPRAPHRGAEDRRSSRGVWGSSTLAEAGSDLHRACLTRLCCAFRFSQPLDALFRLQPLRPCFMPVTPLRFRLQRFPLPGSGRASRRGLPFVPFIAVDPTHCQVALGATSGCKDLRIRGVRSSRDGVIRGPRAAPLMALRLFEAFSPSVSASCFHEASSHGLDTQLPDGEPPRRCACALQSLKEPTERPGLLRDCLPP